MFGLKVESKLVKDKKTQNDEAPAKVELKINFANLEHFEETAKKVLIYVGTGALIVAAGIAVLATGSQIAVSAFDHAQDN